MSHSHFEVELFEMAGVFMLLTVCFWSGGHTMSAFKEWMHLWFNLFEMVHGQLNNDI